MGPRGAIVLALAAGVALTACGTAGAESGDEGGETGGPGVRVVPVEEASELLADDDRIVIDVRTPDEFAEGHLAGARNIDIRGAGFDDQVGELDPDASYLVYCRTANRSAGARQLMAELGFRDVADIAGGTVAWTGAGLPLER